MLRAAAVTATPSAVGVGGGLGGHYVNMFFDRETIDLSVASPYPAHDWASPVLGVTDANPARAGAPPGTLGVTVKTAGPLFVRIPAWADAGAMAPTTAGIAEGDTVISTEHDSNDSNDSKITVRTPKK